jgi:hypothetical protein
MDLVLFHWCRFTSDKVLCVARSPEGTEYWLIPETWRYKIKVQIYNSVDSISQNKSHNYGMSKIKNNLLQTRA